MDNVKVCNLFIKSLRNIKNIEDNINKKFIDNIEFNNDLLKLLRKIYVNTLNYFCHINNIIIDGSLNYYK